MGKETLQEEVHVGDTITITNESTLVEEARRVTMVLGPTAMSLSAPFAADVVTHTRFTVTSMPRGPDGQASAGVRVKATRTPASVWREKVSSATG